MTKKKAMKMLNLLAKKNYCNDRTGDTERNHIEADIILCDFLTSIGHADIVEAYDEIEKWYA